jgi:hypothetical protein
MRMNLPSADTSPVILEYNPRNYATLGISLTIFLFLAASLLIARRR